MGLLIIGDIHYLNPKDPGHSLRSVATHGRKSGHWVPPYAGWLNCTFSKFAFIPEEAKIIEPETGIFLLSIEEAEQYFHSNSERICQLSKYHPDFKESKEMASAKGEWWLRSNGTSPGNAAYVCADGSINRDGKDAYANKLFGVRPAIWIDLQKLCKGIDL